MSSGSSVARVYAIIPRMDSSYRMYGKMEYFQEEDGVVNIVIAMLGAASGYFMLKRNHLGFHGYIVYNLLASGSLYFFVSPSLIPSVILIFNLVVSLVFVLLYAKHLSWMKGEA